MEISAFVSNSNARYRGRTAAEIFVPGCEYKCAYCHSYPLTESRIGMLESEKILDRLSSNVERVNSVVITGGEPLMQGDALVSFCRELRAMGFEIKLETSGAHSIVMEKLLYNGLVDYISLDLKNRLNEYSYFKITRRRVDINQVIRSAQFTRHYSPDYEFSITYVPKLHSFRDVLALSRQLAGSKRFVLQEFVPEFGTLDKFLRNSRKTSYEQLLGMAKQIHGIDEVRIRTRKGEEIISPVKANPEEISRINP